MNFWTSFLGYQAVWFAAVIGAAHGLSWPGVLGWVIFAGCQLAFAPRPGCSVLLMLCAVVMGCLVDGTLIHAGLAIYAAPWPGMPFPPLWILVLWASFSLTFTGALVYLQSRPWLAAVFGAIGGPLAYLGASRGWHVVAFSSPAWRATAVLAVGWAVATPLLAMLAHPGKKDATEGINA
ncbi:DUF2878 domain-containing protein [Pinirhizobacter sp.]|uniref:DUF2878 domain-containing protein n=1 Tax=Pinirhizobacter sp. TaxID=2950432 RepID=UPI002F3FF67D